MSKFKKGDKVVGNSKMTSGLFVGEKFIVDQVEGNRVYVESGGHFQDHKLDLVTIYQQEDLEISAKRMIEVTIKGNTFQLTYEEACSLHNALEESGI